MSYDMTPQQIFDKVATHLFKQAKPASDGFQCVYRADDGCMCAIGVLIADEDYDKEMEGKAASNLYKVSGINPALAVFLTTHDRLVTNLQSVHDGGDGPTGGFKSAERMRELLTSVAESHNLSPAILADLHFPEKSA